MKKVNIKILTTIILILLIAKNVASQNIFPAAGPVGIGTISPTFLLQVDGTPGLTGDVFQTNAPGINTFGGCTKAE